MMKKPWMIVMKSIQFCLRFVPNLVLTLREEHRQELFENRVLRRIFGPKEDEVTEEWRKLHNEGLHDLFSSPTTSIIRIIESSRMKWAGHVARMGRREKRIGC
jgi:hypothetical protein